MTEKDKALGKEKCRELRQRGAIPHHYAKWAKYLIPGYAEYWDNVWRRVLLKEQERIEDEEQRIKDFAAWHEDLVECLEAGYASDPQRVAIKNKDIISHKNTKSKTERRTAKNGNKKT